MVTHDIFVPVMQPHTRVYDTTFYVVQFQTQSIIHQWGEHGRHIVQLQQCLVLVTNDDDITADKVNG